MAKRNRTGACCLTTTGFDNFLASSIQVALNRLNVKGVPELIGSKVTHDLGAFKAGRDVMVGNRWNGELADVADRVYTRDLFKRD